MIIGKKVRFRAIEERDLELLAQWLNDPAIAALVVGWSFPVSMAEQHQWFDRSLTDTTTKRWMVDTYNGETIGLTGLWHIDYQNSHALTALKIGAKEIQGKGYGTDAIMTLMSYAYYELGLNRLWGEILSFNVPSYKAYVHHCGWKVEGVLRQHVLRGGVRHDLLRVACLREDFERLPGAREYIPAPPTARVPVQPSDWASM